MLFHKHFINYVNFFTVMKLMIQKLNYFNSFLYYVSMSGRLVCGENV